MIDVLVGALIMAAGFWLLGRSTSYAIMWVSVTLFIVGATWMLLSAVRWIVGMTS